MTRLVRLTVAASLATLPLLGVAPAAIAAENPAMPAAVSAGVVSADVLSADVNDFTFDSFDADYYLDVDADGRSTLTTVETFVAVFPEDQNRGMRRAIPEEYQDAPTDVEVQSVTDEAGNPRPFEVDTDDGFVIVTSAADDYVSGEQTYVFTYTQHNVTRYFENTDDDEFYWDTNGTGWDQPFGSVTARIHVPEALAASLNGSIACYRGSEGSSDPCEIVAEQEEGGTVFTATASDLAADENVTAAIGFEPGTFVARDDSYFASPAAFGQIAGVIIALLAAIWALVLRATSLADGRGRPTIIAEYTPPKGLDPFIASVLLNKTTRAAAATFIDLAVTRRIKIIETDKTGFLASGTTYLLELVDAKGLEGSELALATALFGPDLVPGTGYLMDSKDTKLSERVRKIVKTATTAANAQGLRRTVGGFTLLPLILSAVGGAVAFFTGVVLLDNGLGGALPALLFIPGVVSLVVVLVSVSRVPLTSKGAELRDHLKGLELYIRLAEADRLRMLQSPTGAEKQTVAADDPRQVVKVYEKLLPYAVLFSLEKDWAEELGKYYIEESPDWYSGSGAFNAGLFAASIGSLSSEAASSFSGSASSSSSGGSGGGGSSGGGGGGGGGGGV